MLSKYRSLLSKRLPVGYIQKQPSKFDNVVIAMSSGVDSSLAAALYQSFPNARGVYMRNWNSQNQDESNKSKNCDEQDWKDACAVADHLNLPIDLLNFEKDYWIDVFEPMLKAYECGVTPNPDVLCNRFIKFGKLVETLDKKYGDGNYWLVTGHYSRVLQNVQTNEFELLRGIHHEKDQSYYLSQVKPNILSEVLLPIGHLKKDEVRSMALEVGLPSASKPDSQGICFVNNSQHGKFKNFLMEYLPSQPGDIITIDEKDGSKRIWGQHEGLWSYTIGQKIGISMPQADPAYKGTWFVSDKLKDSNEIVIVRHRDNASLYKRTVELQDFIPLVGNNFVSFETILEDELARGKLFMQYRSLQNPVPVIKLEYNKAKSTIQLGLGEDQRAMAQGQYGCLYGGSRVLGSGTIIS